HQRADGIVAGPPTGVADHVGVTFLEAGEFGWIEPRVHASQNREAASGRQGKLALVAEIAGIGLIRSKDFGENFRHDALLQVDPNFRCGAARLGAPLQLRPECRRSGHGARATAWRGRRSPGPIPSSASPSRISISCAGNDRRLTSPWPCGLPAY